MKKIVPVILAGGTGTRLWPVSRKSYPKQFSNFLDNQSLFQRTALRLCNKEEPLFHSPIVVTAPDFRFIVEEQLNAIHIEDPTILIEPESKNTGPAILAAAIHVAKTEPESVLLVLPSDHMIKDKDALNKAIITALENINEERILTFGIKPERPETGYGYIEIENELNNKPIPVRRFVEKPNAEKALEMFLSKKFLWNSGIFMFSAKTLISAFEKLAPSFLEPVTLSLVKGKKDLGFFRIDPVSWKEVENISVDYAIMEKYEKIFTLPLSVGWSDLGDWESIWREHKKGENDCVLHGPASAIDCKDVLLRSETKNQQLVGIGLENVFAISMPDAVLIGSKSKAQNVRDAVTHLKKKNVFQAENFSKDFRPWGWFETIALGDIFRVKRIVVQSKQSLSLQSHKFRSEHWVVVEGNATVTIDKQKFELTEGQSCYIPVGAIHRLENLSKEKLTIIEVQTGTYLEEDDIVRYEDKYARN